MEIDFRFYYQYITVYYNGRNIAHRRKFNSKGAFELLQFLRVVES